MEYGDERLPAGLWAKTTVNPETGCWEWQGWRNHAGYARAKFAGETQVLRLHRRTYAAVHGEIPDGMTIDHLCRVRHCINPVHLEAVSQRENALRGNTVNAANLAKTHCLRDHPFDEQNTYRYPDGRRGCRACMAIARAAYQARRAS